MNEDALEDSPDKRRGSGLNWKLWRWETIGSYLLIGIVLVVAVILLGEELEHHVTALENWLAGQGSLALVIAVLLYALCAVIFVPDTLLGLVAGATFGFTRGFAIALLGSLLAASVEYLLALRLLKPLIDRRLASKPAMQALQKAVESAVDHQADTQD